MMLPATGNWPTALIVKGIMCRAFQFSECDFISKSHQLVTEGWVMVAVLGLWAPESQAVVGYCKGELTRKL